MSTTQGRSKSTEDKEYRKFEVGAQQRNQIILGMNKKIIKEEDFSMALI